MRERKVVKIKVDMYDDTKFKIIDTKPERDLIHYVWTRIVTLAGKVDLEGDLYLSRNLPYTIETLAIEFNRDAFQVKLALDVLIELEMIELTCDKIYRVKNFAKHQNIKVKDKIKAKDEKEDLKNEISDNKDEEFEDEINQNKVENAKGDRTGDLEITNKDINIIEDNISDKKINNMQGVIPIHVETKNQRTNNKKNKEGNIDEIVEANTMVCFYDGDKGRPLGKDERVCQALSS